MFPFIDLVRLRLFNTSDTKIKVGFTTLEPGECSDVKCHNAHKRSLSFARDMGVEFVGLVIDEQLYELVPVDSCGRCDEEPVEEPEEEPEEEAVEPEPEPEPEVEPEPEPEVEDEPEPEVEEADEDEEFETLVRAEELMDNHTKAELVEMLEELDLPTTGNKPDLAERIAEHEHTT